ncbi:tRNA uridine-5-carboxymethylaminomethyl(34) synthesis GTPase MnmE [uncultured Jannaschia sp.]|uniref:tRNA uridine-5-carboxymethylaminomethyl(34) synthesis GTPase MnmE n=1 Tax=uncultured Jannaschia sp. TaxID=293347 RepID=UPI002632A670|nr:tRNA uridine-5-carboxymethylaminomethyl(34) synthesis GTPase MnmE [uncultured Jannaschia sp.]
MAGVGDTIFALATAEGKAGLAVIRVSGPASIAILRALSGRAVPARMATLAPVRDSEGRLLDEALVLRFEAGASYTGEDTVEFQLHGSRAIVRAVLAAIAARGQARLAEPGEFTRRALENDRLDLAQVKGLADLIEAETEAQRREALRVFTGELSDRIAGWRSRMIRAHALIEATIDFADEDVPVDVMPEVEDLLRSVRDEIASEIAGAAAARRLRSSFEVAIIGAPNVGKSSLINALSRSEASIVTEIPGTTRDVIEVRMDLQGIPVTFLDTAGLRETDDRVERAGIERARRRAADADLRVLLVDGEARPGDDLIEAADIILRGKSDISEQGDISAVTREGIDAFLTDVADRLSQRVASAGLTTQVRDVQLLEGILLRLDDIAANPDGESELLAVRLREVSDTLGQITGAIGVEDVLGEIFSSFCIGK